MRIKHLLLLIFVFGVCANGTAQLALPARLFFPKFIGSSNASTVNLFHRAISMELMSSSTVALLDSMEVDSVLAMKKSQALEIKSTENALEIARLLDAEKLLMAEYQTSEKKTLIVRCSLLNVHSGRVEKQWIDEDLSAISHSAFCFRVGRQSVSTIQKQFVMENLSKVDHFEPAFALSCTIPKREFRIGEVFDLKIRSAKDCYLYVYDIGTSGITTLIYPADQDGGKKLYAGEEVIIPSILALPPAGTDVIKTIVTQDSLSFARLEELLTQQIISDGATSQARSLRLDESPLAEKKWTTYDLKILIKD